MSANFLGKFRDDNANIRIVNKPDRWWKDDFDQEVWRIQSSNKNKQTCPSHPENFRVPCSFLITCTSKVPIRLKMKQIINEIIKNEFICIEALLVL